jgi:pimeloyl-ACP methyl ester carboxylesterase
MLSASAPAELAKEVEASLSAFHPAGQRVIVSAFGDQDLRDVLQRVAVPTLLLDGGQDVRSPLSVGEGLHALIPGSRLEVMPGVGHVSNIEAPEQFNAAVRAFLQSLDA